MAIKSFGQWAMGRSGAAMGNGRGNQWPIAEKWAMGDGTQRSCYGQWTRKPIVNSRKMGNGRWDAAELLWAMDEETNSQSPIAENGQWAMGRSRAAMGNGRGNQ